MDLGYHLCYGSPADEHLVMPKDMGILVEMSNGLASRLQRRLDFLHLPVPKDRSDREYFLPLEGLRLPEKASLVLGLIHHNDGGGGRGQGHGGTRIPAHLRGRQRVRLGTHRPHARSGPAGKPPPGGGAPEPGRIVQAAWVNSSRIVQEYRKRHPVVPRPNRIRRKASVYWIPVRSLRRVALLLMRDSLSSVVAGDIWLAWASSERVFASR